MCTTKQSAQQVIFQMYNAVSIAELKGYAMMQFSWMILRTYGKGKLRNEYVGRLKLLCYSIQ